VWRAVRELTGTVSPFTERIRSEIQEELEAEQQEKINALKAEQDARIAEIRAATDQETLNRLMDRLMALAGYGQKSAEKADGA
jgi:hypothetical protein